jgi:hypothetical protein
MPVISCKTRRLVRALCLSLIAVFVGVFEAPAEAPRIANAVANFAALDKVTAKVEQLPVPLNKTAEFRTLKITPRVCYTSDPKEPPRTSTFVEVDEVLFDGTEKRIFTGWMFAESPGLNPLVHAVFDVWLTGCSRPQNAPASEAPPSERPPPPRKRPPR